MKHPKLNKALLKFQGECGQVEQKLQPRISFGEVSVGYYPADGLCAVVTVNNSDGTAPLDEILARDIAPTPRQKYALYERYLRESPDYCKENAWCYSFYNMGGCSSCPFPCGRRQALFERAERLAAESDTAD